MADTPSPRRARLTSPKVEAMPPNADPPANVAVLIERMRGEIGEKLARIEGKSETIQVEQQAAQKAADHRHANVMQAIETFVPRKEIESNHRSVLERIDAVDKDARARDVEVEKDARERDDAISAKVKSIETKAWAALVGVISAVGLAALGVLGKITLWAIKAGGA